MERVVSDLRGELYRRWGAVSALALPPLVPLRGWALAVPPAEASAILADAAVPLDVVLERYERVEGCLYLMVAAAGLDALCARIDDAARAAGDREPAPIGLFPARRGFFLAGPDLEAPVEEVGQALPVPAERRFGSYALSIMRVCVHAPLERWWELVSWDEEVCVPVKRSGRAAPGSAARGPAVR
jgi:hypothetical protein